MPKNGVLTFSILDSKEVFMDSLRNHPLLPILEDIPHQPGRTFLHRVDSQQWRELGIEKSDYLLLEFRTLKDQDLALILHQGQSLLTRYHHLPSPRFAPPSPAQTIPTQDAVLQGVVSCLVRAL